jgi:hypothetical protein
MKLNLKDRLVISGIMPSEGNFTTMVIKSDLLKKLQPTQDEIKELEIEQHDDMMKWNISKDLEKDFDLTELESNLINDTLKKLDDNGKLNDDTFTLYKKIK